ncbi:MAG TPA: hypothetical protein VD993_00425 [Chitinophagaceae bacterium]|nr:hypothetical protein [Chitinophagaceae bacterium]
MKKIILAMCCLSAVVLTSCQADDTPEPTTQQKLLGKWRVQKVVDEYYKPVNTLVETDEIIGAAGDSVVFKSNNEVYSYSDTEDDGVSPYRILDENTIEIEDEIYKIKTLTNTELYLHLDHTQQAINERYVQRLYLVR